MYVPVTQNRHLNDSVINKLKLFMMSLGLSNFKTDSIIANLDLQTFTTRPVNKGKSSRNLEVSNLFLLTNSTLGNFINPERVLTNIYRSMENGDSLVIVQGLYRPGSEDQLVDDYRNLMPSLKPFIDVGHSINADAEIYTSWEDKDFTGVKMVFRMDEETEFAGVTLKEKQKITLFRSTRFKEWELKKLFIRIGFKIISIAYDEYMDNGLFFLRK
jgi:hypothetical protein